MHGCREKYHSNSLFMIITTGDFFKQQHPLSLETINSLAKMYASALVTRNSSADHSPNAHLQMSHSREHMVSVVSQAM